MMGREYRMMTRFLQVVSIVALVTTAACSDKPAVDSLRDSFALQVAANRFVKDFQRTGDELLFTAPDTTGNSAKWRVHIDSFVIETDEETKRYKGTVKSSWFANGEPVIPSGRESNLPVELLDNGISQDCWAWWEPDARRWGWE
jgi:hypothetical protein